MITSVIEAQIPDAMDVSVTDDTLIVVMSDGRTLSVPIVWYPRLLHATRQERNNWELTGGGYGIHWPDVDEDISVEGLIAGRQSQENRQHFSRWLDARRQNGANDVADDNAAPNDKF